MGDGMNLQSPSRNFNSNLLKSPARIPSMNFVPSMNNRRRRDNLIHKTVIITSGQWKGYAGIVIDATNTIARVELHTQPKTINVDRTFLKVKGEEEMRPIDTFPATPFREDITATPLRVPRTPVHGTAWDPNQPNTPIRATTPSWDLDNSSFNFPSTTTPYNPYDSTPETRTPSTPGFTPGTNFTPGYIEHRTPQEQHTPYTPTTPGLSTPSTPGTPLENISINSTSEDRSELGTDWLTTDIEIQIKSGSYNGSKGVIKEVYDKTAKIILYDTNESITVSFDQIEPVPPAKKDIVKIIRGEMKGAIGTLVGIDNRDGIVKLISNLDIKMLDLQSIAKYISTT